MKNVGMRRHQIMGFAIFLVVMPLHLLLTARCFSETNEKDAGMNTDNESGGGVNLTVTYKEVIIDNGIVQITIANPEGYLTGVSYNGVDNLLETRNVRSNRGYWDIVWDTQGYNGSDWLTGTNMSIILQDDDQVEVSFKTNWDSANWNSSANFRRLPVNVDRRYIMLSGCSGFYSYAILEREEGWPAVNIYQIRAVYKLDQKQFHYMAISDDRQRIMPMPQDRENGLPLAFKEAVLLTDPIDPDLRGEVDDKYQYSVEDKDNKVHGWISSDPPIGFWVITPSNEFRSNGPIKQDLTSHVGPITLAMFHSAHYAGFDVTMAFQKGEPWKKVFGPYFVYLNSACEDEDFNSLWDDAKLQMIEEVGSWPYEFPLSEDFPNSFDRGFVYGRLQVSDKYKREKLMPATSAWIGLAAPGDPGSWQTESKGYQFWTRADRHGNFLIKGIREGVYNLYAWVPGFLGDYAYTEDILVTPGSAINLGNLVYEPPRNGHTIWKIGTPDRSASEFFVPEANRLFLNKLYTASNVNKFRQYGLWERYAEMYPDNDLIYTVGVSNYHKDWFFAHVTRRTENMTYKATTWQIVFPLKEVIPSCNYTLRVALASATRAELQVRFNDPELKIAHFTTPVIGTDNAIARHGIHGLYRLFNVVVPSEWLRIGNNTIYLTQTKHDTPFQGVMYDYIRLEAPPTAI